MNREFPDLLKRLHAIELDVEGLDWIDFEPFDEFFSEEETAEWIKAWTGNASLDGSEYLIFGQDGSGGYVAFWCVRETGDLLQQPVVFFGSEGELGVLAQNFYAYAWLFAGGAGPYEAATNPGLGRTERPEFRRFAEQYAPSEIGTVNEIVARARQEFPGFEQAITELCR